RVPPQRDARGDAGRGPHRDDGGRGLVQRAREHSAAVVDEDRAPRDRRRHRDLFLEGESADTLRASLAEHRKRLRATIAAYEALPYFPTERERWESTYEAIEHAEEESTT